MNEDLANVSRQDVLNCNLQLHQATAEQYDQVHYYLRNRVEQWYLWDDLKRVHSWLQRDQAGEVWYADLGCGTGNITLKLLELGACVVGVDLSPRMIQVLNNKVARAGFKDRFIGLVGSADDLTNLPVEREILRSVRGVCISSVLHHLYDYLEPFRQFPALMPLLDSVYITHEPVARGELRAPGGVRRASNFFVRQLDIRLSRFIQRPREHSPDSPVADLHAYKAGIGRTDIEQALAPCSLRHRLLYRTYNMRRTTTASVLDNWLLRSLRNDIFPVTMFTMALVRNPDPYRRLKQEATAYA